MAAYCAADQNRFWDYKKLLYTNSQEISGVFSEARLKAFAESLQLDMTAFEACYDDGRFQPEIENDLALGKQMGVTGTPSVFVNGKDVSPGQVPSYSQILTAVQAATGE
jgi:protein-disulfide isomerase